MYLSVNTLFNVKYVSTLCLFIHYDVGPTLQG